MAKVLQGVGEAQLQQRGKGLLQPPPLLLLLSLRLFSPLPRLFDAVYDDALDNRRHVRSRQPCGQLGVADLQILEAC